MASQPHPRLTPLEYLEIERKAEYKSEYFRGEMFALAGASREHNLASGNLYRELSQQLRKTPCEVYPSDMRVEIGSTGLYTYPDVVVVCGKPQFADSAMDTLLNPVLLAEILSPSTEAYDRGRKFEHYRTIESLQEYLLVATDRMSVDLYARQPDGRWLLSTASLPEQTVELRSVECTLHLRDVYEKVELPES